MFFADVFFLFSSNEELSKLYLLTLYCPNYFWLF